MADVWEIAEYVESHPDNYDQRWRLCKKLYTAWEYRLALEHLLVLKNEWSDRLNVRRYLAATYYRLSRYEEAVTELEEIVVTWPKEATVHEQLARAYEKAGRRPDAIQQWEIVLEANPDHHFAKKALKGNKRAEQKEAEPTVNYMQNIMAPTSTGGTTECTCAKCGAQNGREFERCWQCHALLPATTPQSLPPKPIEEAQAKTLRSVSSTVPWTAVIGLTFVGMLTLAIYLSLSEYSTIQERGSEIPESVGQLLSAQLWQMRLIIAGLLLISWPLVLRLATGLLDIEVSDHNTLHVSGVFLTTLTYLMTWWSSGSPLLNLAIPILASFIVVFFAFGVSPLEAMTLWALQGILIVVIIVAPVAAMLGFGFLRETPALMQAAIDSEFASPTLVSGTAPVSFEFTPHQTKSAWLNELVQDVVITVEAESLEERMFVEILDGERTREYVQVKISPFKHVFTGAIPGRTYQLTIKTESQTPIEASASIRGVFTIPIEGEASQ